MSHLTLETCDECLVTVRARASARARVRVTCVDIGALSDDLVRVRGSG